MLIFVVKNDSIHTQHKLNYFVEKSLRNKITTTSMDGDEDEGCENRKKGLKL